MKTIILIIPYFGKWPEWIDLFFDSCIRNYDVDFLFFTDCESPDFIAPNIKICKTSFDDYCKRISETLGIRFHPHNPYKLCDMRPFYAIIHKEEIKGYDFWGYADIDLCFGNIRKFYGDNILSKYNVLSTYTNQLTGHLALLRNKTRYNTLCFKIRGWQRLLESEDNWIMDEAFFSYLILPGTRITRKIVRLIQKYISSTLASMVSKLFYAFLIPSMKVLRVRFVDMKIHPLWNGSNCWIYSTVNDSLQKPKVVDVGEKEERIYCHFLPLKNNWKDPSCFEIKQPINNLLITVEGINPVSNNVS